MVHAERSASSAARWMACPGSVALIRNATDPGASSAAALGTAAHEVAEMSLKFGVHPGEFSGMEIEVEGHRLIVDQEMVRSVALFVTTVHGVARVEKGTIFTERRVSLPEHIGEGMFGTSDAAVVGFQRGTILDYKHGTYTVEAEGNPQLAYYALAVAYAHNLEEIDVVIVQPRAHHRLGPIRSARLRRGDLAKWETYFMFAAAETERPNAPLAAGPHCFFCLAKPTCPEYRRVHEQSAVDAFSTALPGTEA